ncbi:MAG: hypothetical protein QW343_01835 [Candidatus Norongarragalinales archaeon]
MPKHKESSKCDRCGKPHYYFEPCDYCGERVCRQCQKSSKNASKTRRLVICKSCWTSSRKRKEFLAA